MKELVKKLLGIKPFLEQLDSYLGLKYSWYGSELYRIACEKTRTKPFPLHEIRCYNTIQFLKTAPEGEVAEIGVLHGALSYQIRATTGKPIHLFDSFEGLSEPTEKDNAGHKGAMAVSLETVKQNLSDFPDIKYYKGFVPERFNEVKDLRFSFVYIDVDLYQPARDSLEFFYPRMLKGGIIMIDDYGFNTFTGCKKAVDEISEKLGFKIIPLSSGQCVIF